MVTLMAKRGRPKKMTEPLVLRHFELPESLNLKLIEATKPAPQQPHGRDAVEIVREALLEKLDKEGQAESIEDQVKRAVSEALRENGVLPSLLQNVTQNLKNDENFGDAAKKTSTRKGKTA